MTLSRMEFTTSELTPRERKYVEAYLKREARFAHERHKRDLVMGSIGWITITGLISHSMHANGLVWFVAAIAVGLICGYFYVKYHVRNRDKHLSGLRDILGKNSALVFSYSVSRAIKLSGVDDLPPSYLLELTSGQTTVVYVPEDVRSSNLPARNFQIRVVGTIARPLMQSVVAKEDALVPEREVAFKQWANRKFPSMFELSGATIEEILDGKLPA